MKCWASQFTFNAVEYKRNYGELINSQMAVVIQQMVDCDSSGVIFTCDPVTGDERFITITANYGLGEVIQMHLKHHTNIYFRLSFQLHLNPIHFNSK